MKIKKLSFLLLLVIFLSNSCKEKTEVLKVGYIPIAECVQLYVAQDMGYFEKYNVKIELISLAGGAKILNALNSGSIDVGFSNVVSLVLHKTQGSQFYSIFGSTIETKFNQNHALLINKKIQTDDIKTTLTGSTIAINTYKNIEELMVRKYLDHNGVNWDDVEKVTIPFPRMLPALESGDITVASIVEPFISISSLDTNGNTIYYANHYLSTTPKTLVATYVSSNESLTKKKKSLIGFIKAMNDATEYIRNNESEAREIIGNYTKIPKQLLPKIGLSKFEKELDLELLSKVIDDMVKYEYVESEKLPELSSFKYKLD